MITVALKKEKTETVNILLDNPCVDLDNVDREGRFLKNIARLRSKYKIRK